MTTTVPSQSATGSMARRMRLHGVAALLVLGFGVWQNLRSWQRNHAFLINVSPSLPNWAFVLETRAPPGRGALIFFRPPSSPVLINNFGAKPQLFGKQVYGVAGDIVTHRGRAVFINGRQVAVAKPRSRKGEPLAMGPTGVIPSGCYYVGTSHRDGFDSRYALIGFVCLPAIAGTGTAVL